MHSTTLHADNRAEVAAALAQDHLVVACLCAAWCGTCSSYRAAFESGLQPLGRLRVAEVGDARCLCDRADPLGGLPGRPALVDERAHRLYELMVAYEGRNVVSLGAVYLGPVARYLGLLAMWLSDGDEQVRMVLGWAHGIGWILISLLCIAALRRRVVPLWLAVTVVVIGGLGPFAGTLALALHTTGVLGRLFAESLENASPASLQHHGDNALAAVRGLMEADLSRPLEGKAVFFDLFRSTVVRWPTRDTFSSPPVMGCVFTTNPIGWDLGLRVMNCPDGWGRARLGTALCLAAVAGYPRMRPAPRPVWPWCGCA